MAVFSLAERNKKGIVVLVNKWDLVEKDTHTAKRFEDNIREKIAPFSDIPIIFMSVLNKQRIYKAVEEAVNVFERRQQKISTSKLNDLMLPIIQATPPPATKGKLIKIKFCTQLPTRVPSFAFFANLPQYIKDPYKRFLENQLRQHYDFNGVPIQIFMRKK